MGWGSQPHALDASTPGKTWYLLYRRLGGPQGQFGWAENLIPTGIQSRTVQPIVAIPKSVAMPTELPDPLYFILTGSILLLLHKTYEVNCFEVLLTYVIDPSYYVMDHTAIKLLGIVSDSP